PGDRRSQLRPPPADPRTPAGHRQDGRAERPPAGGVARLSAGERPNVAVGPPRPWGSLPHGAAEYGTAQGRRAGEVAPRRRPVGRLRRRHRRGVPDPALVLLG